MSLVIRNYVTFHLVMVAVAGLTCRCLLVFADGVFGIGAVNAVCRAAQVTHGDQDGLDGLYPVADRTVAHHYLY